MKSYFIFFFSILINSCNHNPSINNEYIVLSEQDLDSSLVNHTTFKNHNKNAELIIGIQLKNNTINKLNGYRTNDTIPIVKDLFDFHNLFYDSEIEKLTHSGKASLTQWDIDEYKDQNFIVIKHYLMWETERNSDIFSDTVCQQEIFYKYKNGYTTIMFVRFVSKTDANNLKKIARELNN